jgi:hypothetical protein
MLDGLFDDTILDHVVQALVQNDEFLQLIDTVSFSPSRSRHIRARVGRKDDSQPTSPKPIGESS